MSASLVTAVATLTALATGLGAAPFLLARRPPRAWLSVANALAAGFMAGASVGLVLEGRPYGGARVTVGVAAGVAFIELSRRALGHRQVHATGFEVADATRMVLIVAVMTVHSITEGIGVGVSFGGGDALGLVVALAIAVHNIPEGLAISLVLVPRGVSVPRAAWWSVFSSLPQPFMALPAFVFVDVVKPLLPLGLGFAAGAMLWMVAVELVPEAVRGGSARTVALVGCASALTMVAAQSLLL